MPEKTWWDHNAVRHKQTVSFFPWPSARIYAKLNNTKSCPSSLYFHLQGLTVICEKFVWSRHTMKNLGKISSTQFLQIERKSENMGKNTGRWAPRGSPWTTEPTSWCRKTRTSRTTITKRFQMTYTFTAMPVPRQRSLQCNMYSNEKKTTIDSHDTNTLTYSFQVFINRPASQCLVFCCWHNGEILVPWSNTMSSSKVTAQKHKENRSSRKVDLWYYKSWKVLVGKVPGGFCYIPTQWKLF